MRVFQADVQAHHRRGAQVIAVLGQTRRCSQLDQAFITAPGSADGEQFQRIDEAPRLLHVTLRKSE